MTWLIVGAVLVVLLLVAAVLVVLGLRRSLEPSGPGWSGPRATSCEETSAVDERSLVEGPRAVGGLVVVPAYGAVVGLHPASLVEQWCYPCDVPRRASPVAGSHPDIEVITCGWSYIALDATTGEELWSIEAEMAPDRHRVTSSTFAVQSDVDGITAYGLHDGEVVYETSEPDSASPAGDDRHVFTATGDWLSAFDNETGDLAWRHSGSFSAVAAGGGFVYARTNTHEVHRYDPESGDLLAVSPDRWPHLLGWSEFVYADGDAVVLWSTTDGILTVLEAADLTMAWSVDEVSNAGVGDGVVAFVRNDGSADARDLLTAGSRVGEVRGAVMRPPAVLGGRMFFVRLSPTSPNSGSIELRLAFEALI